MVDGKRILWFVFLLVCISVFHFVNCLQKLFDYLAYSGGILNKVSFIILVVLLLISISNGIEIDNVSIYLILNI